MIIEINDLILYLYFIIRISCSASLCYETRFQCRAAYKQVGDTHKHRYAADEPPCQFCLLSGTSSAPFVGSAQWDRLVQTMSSFYCLSHLQCCTFAQNSDMTDMTSLVLLKQHAPNWFIPLMLLPFINTFIIIIVKMSFDVH